MTDTGIQVGKLPDVDNDWFSIRNYRNMPLIIQRDKEEQWMLVSPCPPEAGFRDKRFPTAQAARDVARSIIDTVYLKLGKEALTLAPTRGRYRGVTYFASDFDDSGCWVASVFGPGNSRYQIAGALTFGDIRLVVEEIVDRELRSDR